jgi:ABC-type protease/lipase transport system fused ATPase/permease subunit
MSKKTSYKLWFVIGALYLLGAIYPLAVRDRNFQHRSVLTVMGLVWIGVGISYKKKYVKSLVEAPVSSSSATISQ